MKVKVLVLKGEGPDDDFPDLFLVVPVKARRIDVLDGEVAAIAEVNTLENAKRIVRLWNKENLN